MNERKTFVFYAEWKEIIQHYPTDLKIELYEAIVDYAVGNDVNLSPTAGLIFPFIKIKLDVDINKYEAIAERNKANGAKGGRKPKETEHNPKNPMGIEKTKETERNPKNLDNDNYNGLLSNSKELSNNKEKKNNINIIPKKEKSFKDVFEEFKVELLGENNELWRETVTRKFGIKNHALALDEFKAHVIAQGNDGNVAEHNINEFKAYFANIARMGIFSDTAKSEPKVNQRKPCVFYTQRTGQGIIGVIAQDGNIFYVPKDVGYPPTESHYWNPASKQYEVQQR